MVQKQFQLQSSDFFKNFRQNDSVIFFKEFNCQNHLDCYSWFKLLTDSTSKLVPGRCGSWCWVLPSPYMVALSLPTQRAICVVGNGSGFCPVFPLSFSPGFLLASSSFSSRFSSFFLSSSFFSTSIVTWSLPSTLR